MTRAPAVAIAVVLLALACGRAPAPAVVPPAPVPAPPVQPPPWQLTLDTLRQLLAEERHAEADRLLRLFAEVHPDSVASAETEFWRAFIRADPGNPAADPRAAVAALDSYIARGPKMPRYAEASTVRRILATTDSLRFVITATRTSAEQRDKVREDSVMKLNKDLEATKAELDRIKKRLTKP